MCSFIRSAVPVDMSIDSELRLLKIYLHLHLASVYAGISGLSGR